MTDRLFSNDSHFVFGEIMSKNRFRFLKGHICFDNPQERTQLWEADRFAAVKRDLGNLQFKSFKACCIIGTSFN